ncbi:hypothetical protein D3C80_1278970 [compost metagenome]
MVLIDVYIGKGLKYNPFSIYIDFPDLTTEFEVFRNKINQRTIFQSPVLDFPVTKITKTSSINYSFSICCYGAYNLPVGHFILLPILTIIAEQSLRIAKIHDTIFVLGNRPVLIAGTIS